MSGISWLQRVREYFVRIAALGLTDIRFPQINVHIIDTTNLAYPLEDQHLLDMDEDHLRPHWLPPRQLALVLSRGLLSSAGGPTLLGAGSHESQMHVKTRRPKTVIGLALASR